MEGYINGKKIETLYNETRELKKTTMEELNKLNSTLLTNCKAIKIMMDAAGEKIFPSLLLYFLRNCWKIMQKRKQFTKQILMKNKCIQCIHHCEFCKPCGCSRAYTYFSHKLLPVQSFIYLVRIGIKVDSLSYQTCCTTAYYLEHPAIGPIGG